MRRPQPDRENKHVSPIRECDALPPGEWVVRHGIKIRVPDKRPNGYVNPDPWPAIELCDDCDTAHVVGESCPTCLAWAERNAEKWEREQERFANRHLIWAILDARKSVAA